MKRSRKILLWILAIVVIGSVAAFVAMRGNGDDENEIPTIEVVRGDVTDKALAIGTIEPRVEVDVKSQFSGVVRRLFADVGDFVKAGTKLIEIQPNPTPKELVDAERQIDLRQIDLNNLKREYDRQKQLVDKGLISAQEFDRAQSDYEQADLQIKMAREQLALLREGKVSTADGEFESVIRAPTTGFILEKSIEVGDPVVPLSSFQEGTVLMSMADMNDLIFRGTVDEIDVGRLKESMPVAVKIGALPAAQVKGVLTKIWLKATTEENSTVFPVEIEILEAVQEDASRPEAEPIPVILRAGYSANAEIIIEERKNVLVIPERVVEFAGDTARVTVVLADQTLEERIVETGLSDAINLEILAGLDEGSKVREKPPKEIE
jgi:HlyD family secretion protein